MCELILTGLTYSCGPYTVVLCDSQGSNCIEIIITPDENGETGTITYPDGTTETYEDGKTDIDIPSGLTVLLQPTDVAWFKSMKQNYA